MIVFGHQPGATGIVKKGGNIWSDVPAFNSGARKTNGDKVHPTQKPVEYFEKMIDSMRHPDLTPMKTGTLLDPFSGSGSSAVAAIRKGWKFIGMELQEKYWTIANRRIAEEYAKAA